MVAIALRIYGDSHFKNGEFILSPEANYTKRVFYYTSLIRGKSNLQYICIMSEIKSGITPKWIYDIIFKKKYRYLKHMLFWLFIYSEEFLGLLNVTENLDVPFYYILLEILIDMCVVYFNIYYLLPKYFLKAKVFHYGFFTFLTTLIIAVAYPILYDFTDIELSMISYYISIIVGTSSVIMMAVAFKLIEMMYQSEHDIRELKETNLQTELAYLKTQVNPHFLFNTLNNLYIMSKKEDKNTPESILQLSDLLRYQLYDCESDYVQLSKEVDYLKNYIELEKLRRQDMDIQLEISGDIQSFKIRPLMFLPFVENAFKYSNTGGIGSAFIHIALHVDQSSLKFSCENNIGSIKGSDVGGIGLTNASRRLELAYPDRHRMDVQNDNSIFRVEISLQE